MSERENTYRPTEDLSETEGTITYKDYQGVDVKLCLTNVKDHRLIKDTKESVYDEGAINSILR